MVTLAGLFEVNVPSGRVLAALVPALVVLAAFIVWCLVDLAHTPRVQYLPKAVWALVIVLFSPPFGAIAYLVLGKDRYDRNLDAERFDSTDGMETGDIDEGRSTRV